MSRELKFRAWSDKYQIFIGHEHIILEDSEWCAVFPTGEVKDLGQVIATDDNIAIEQWTGLTDSKGVDIYEGDILSNEFDEPTIVEWDNTRLRYLLKTKGEVPYIFPDDADLTEDHVIGNIHEK